MSVYTGRIATMKMLNVPVKEVTFILRDKFSYVMNLIF